MTPYDEVKINNPALQVELASGESERDTDWPEDSDPAGGHDAPRDGQLGEKGRVFSEKGQRRFAGTGRLPSVSVFRGGGRDG